MNDKQEHEELNLRMFDSTGNYAIDKILEAIGDASKWCHNTRDWSDHTEFGELGLWSLIQMSANEAAKKAKEIHLRNFKNTGNRKIDEILELIDYMDFLSKIYTSCDDIEITKSENREYISDNFWDSIQKMANEAAKELGSDNA